MRRSRARTRAARKAIGPLGAGIAAVLGAGPLEALAPPARAPGTQIKTLAWSRLATDEERLRVHVDYGAGELRLLPARPGVLYRAQLHFDEEFGTPTVEYERERLRIGLSVRDRGRFRGGRPTDSSMELRLPTGIPLDLDIHFGAGTADLDLTGLPIRRLEVNTGASSSELRIGRPNPERMESASIGVGAAELEVRGLGNLNAENVEVRAGLGSVTLGLDGAWPPGARLDVEMGLGALQILYPESLGVRLRASNLLGSVDAEGLVRSGKTYRSTNWETAERRVEIDVSAALGSIEVKRMP